MGKRAPACRNYLLAADLIVGRELCSVLGRSWRGSQEPDGGSGQVRPRLRGCKVDICTVPCQSHFLSVLGPVRGSRSA